MQPLVSVIMPVYNGHDHIRQCLESVMNQTLTDLEIICVDDGSEDDSVEILNEYAAKDSRIKVIVQENGGAGAARNNGLRHASGMYLSFLDSDDFFEPEMLEHAVNHIQKDRADFVVFRCDQYMDDIKEFKKADYTMKTANLPPYTPFSRRNITNNVFKAFVGWAWDKLYDADFVRRNNLYFQEQRTSNDLLFVFSALVLAKRIGYFEEVLAHQRRNNAVSLSNTREKSWFCFYNALSALRDFLKEKGLYEELERDFVNYALHFSLWNLNTITGATYPILYNKLKEEWFEDLGITAHMNDGQKGPEAGFYTAPGQGEVINDYFYDQGEYRQFLEIMERPAEEYPVKLSVVVTAYNAEKSIKRCLNSILKNQKLALEVIVVDDCSTDGTADIVESYALEYPNVRLIRNEETMFPGGCRNIGLDAAIGRYVHFISADDIVVSGAYARIYGTAVKNQVDFIKASAIGYDIVDDEIVDKPGYPVKNLEHNDDGKILSFSRTPVKILTGIAPVCWNGLYKRSFLKENGIRFNSLYLANENSFFAETCIKSTRVMVLHQNLVKHKVVSGVLLADERMDHFAEQFEAYKIMEKICDENSVSEDIRFRLLDSEMFDTVSWLRRALDEEKTTAARQQLKEFADESVDMELFEKHRKESRWMKYDL